MTATAVRKRTARKRKTVPQGTPTLYEFSVAQYLRMVETGVLGPDDHVELIEGRFVNKVSRNPPHDGTVNSLNKRLLRLLPEAWVLRVQSALILAKSVPEPDLAIVRGPDTMYFRRHLIPSDVGLLIEVADSSRLSDRREKGLRYAEGRISEFWLINLVETQVEVYTQPRAGKSPGYRQRRNYQGTESVPLMLQGQEIACLAVSELCPITA